jgi:hypothetical protein
MTTDDDEVIDFDGIICRDAPDMPAATDEEAPQASRKPRAMKWTAVADADADLIARSQRPETYALCLAVWHTLVRESSYRRSRTVTLSDSVLADRCHVSRNTVRKATRMLHALGLLKSASGYVPGSKSREPLTRELHPAVSPYGKAAAPCADNEQPCADGEQAPPVHGNAAEICADSYSSPPEYRRGELCKKKQYPPAAPSGVLEAPDARGACFSGKQRHGQPPRVSRRIDAKGGEPW